MKFKSLSLYLFLVFLIAGTILTSFALKAKASSPDDIGVSTVPENPIPNQNTVITLSSYVDDLNSVLITWSVNGKKISSGIGDKSVSVTAPALGKKITVIATISLFDGDLNKTISIKPSTIVMLWEANSSYVPPFYKGKAMPTPDSEVKIVALPEIKNGSSFVNPKNMTYSWQLDGTNDQNSSGYGKNSFLYVSDYLDSSNNVSVTASTIDQQDSIDGSVDVKTITPKIEFYKKDPYLGTLWDQTLTNGHQISGNEIIQAAPYFISPKSLNIPFLTFTWSINDSQITVPDYSKNLLPVQTQTGTSGTAKINLEINNIHDLVQTATKEINVQF